MSASQQKTRLRKSLSKRKRLTAPCFSCFNRWVALAQGNQILFKNREILSRLQNEYESGRRSGTDIKAEANKMVNANVQRMSRISATLKTRINGREVFNLPAAHHQLWLSCVCPESPPSPDSQSAAGATCFIACREKQPEGDYGIVDLYFRLPGTLPHQPNSVYQYQFGMDTRESALLFASKLHRALAEGTVAADRPVKGAFAILCINLSHTPNEQVKLRVIQGTIHVGQGRLREIIIPRAQALLRGYKTRLRWKMFLEKKKKFHSLEGSRKEALLLQSQQERGKGQERGRKLGNEDKSSKVSPPLPWSFFQQKNPDDLRRQREIQEEMKEQQEKQAKLMILKRDKKRRRKGRQKEKRRHAARSIQQHVRVWLLQRQHMQESHAIVLQSYARLWLIQLNFKRRSASIRRAAIIIQCARRQQISRQAARSHRHRSRLLHYFHPVIPHFPHCYYLILQQPIYYNTFHQYLLVTIQ